MLKSFKAVIEKDGRIRPLEEVKLEKAQKVLITILEEEDSDNETALLSEEALGEDWNKEEEDKAWQHLQKDK